MLPSVPVCLREQRILEAPVLLLGGGVLYYGLELLVRGYSHWSMAILGGVCLWLIYALNREKPRLLLPVRALLCASLITGSEFLFGCVLNLWLKWNIWDYSELPFDLLGQICLPYFILWFLLSLPVCLLCTLIRRVIFFEEV